jgi:serine/threonine-protein kinase
MDLIEGKSLSDRIPESTERPREAAALVKAIALAVHHGHQRRILHNDLKPANILLDVEGQPHVTDFGLAKRFGEDVTSSTTGAVEGTASYMSPEQAEGRELTTASDVYGLGAILYTLLTGIPPFRGQTVQETLQLVRTETPKPPRTLNPKVDSTLEAICLKCLQKDKAQRYASANALAQDLIRYLARQETVVLPWTRRERVAGWYRRHTVEAGLAAAVVAIWIFAVVMALSVAIARKAELLVATRNAASYAAQNLATTALLELRSLTKTAETAAADRTFADLVGKDDRDGLQRYLEKTCGSQTNLLSNCRVLNDAGIELAEVRLVDVPPANDPIGQDFSFRDYFQVPKNSRSPHISGVFRSQTDLLYKFSVGAPILDSAGKFLGVIAGSVTTDAAMGLVILHKPINDDREVALLAPRAFDGSEAGSGSNAGKYVVVFHPAYRRGVEAVEFPDNSKFRPQRDLFGERQLDLPDPSLAIPPDDDYRDPVAAVDKTYEGRWIAGFAPVGNTGFVVVVQQRFDDAVSLEASTFWRLALWSALASLVALAILGIVFWRWTRSQRLETD